MTEQEILEQIEDPEEEEFADVAPSEGTDAGSTDRAEVNYKVGTARKARYQLTQKVKDDLMNMVCNEMGDLQLALNTMKQSDPKGYATTMAQLLKFVAPTLASQTLEVEGDTNITIEHKLNMLMNPQSYVGDPVPGQALINSERAIARYHEKKNEVPEPVEPQKYFMKHK